MPARTPEELLQRIAETFSAHDVEGAVALYEPNATLVHQPGQVATETEAIREALGGLLGMRPTAVFIVIGPVGGCETSMIRSHTFHEQL